MADGVLAEPDPDWVRKYGRAKKAVEDEQAAAMGFQSARNKKKEAGAPSKLNMLKVKKIPRMSKQGTAAAVAVAVAAAAAAGDAAALIEQDVTKRLAENTAGSTSSRQQKRTFEQRRELSGEKELTKTRRGLVEETVGETVGESFAVEHARANWELAQKIREHDEKAASLGSAKVEQPKKTPAAAKRRCEDKEKQFNFDDDSGGDDAASVKLAQQLQEEENNCSRQRRTRRQQEQGRKSNPIELSSQ
eukprot:COSAG05_NODE_30_length_28869_cov_54.944421_2_plen_247_part_00